MSDNSIAGQLNAALARAGAAENLADERLVELEELRASLAIARLAAVAGIAVTERVEKLEAKVSRFSWLADRCKRYEAALVKWRAAATLAMEGNLSELVLLHDFGADS